MRLNNKVVLARPEAIHEGAVNHFRNNLAEHSTRGLLTLNDLIMGIVTVEENGNLVSLHTEAEVKMALSSIPKDNSLEPNGFGSGFYLACWDIVKADLLEAA